MINFSQVDEEVCTEEDYEWDHWNGKGHLTFTVLSHCPESKYCPHELEYEDYSGCVGGLSETLGIEYAINEGILDVGKLHIGVTYHVEGITALWSRGDGWTTDDDVDYYVETVKRRIKPISFVKAWWWHLVGWKIRQWKNN